MSNRIGVLLLATLLGSVASAADWPQWRGPHRDGVSAETGLYQQWPKDGPKLIWQVNDLGGGFSTPAVVGNRLYLLTSTGKQDEFVKALSTADGKTLWSTRIGAVGEPNQQPAYPAARSTPTVDGDALYALGSDGDLVCLETASGKLRWHKNLRTDFAGKPGRWAYAESPLLDGDALVCTPGGAAATVVALNKKTGDVIWKAPLPQADQAGYASITVMETAGVKQYVQFLEKGLVGLDAKTGKLLWRYDKTADKSPANIPTPVARDGYVYSAASMGTAAVVKITGDASAMKAREVYENRRLPSAIGGAVLVGDYLYGSSNSVLQCVEFKSGTVKWTDRSIAPASVCFADGLLFLHGETGEVALAAAAPDGYHEKGRFTPPNPPDRGMANAKAWAYPALSNGRLYIRDAGTLWCYEVGPSTASARR